ncbi:uncharacterized protein LOC123654761 [Melitaea cinxia]|uniref:uncharacterized protein LOC123654761 n=1 Tax=Melitaea cinxia TaxID=113334 RepID=UPI001E27039E|nr:uncharacterized protein LOC123654761 [Melitaea cinxia]
MTDWDLIILTECWLHNNRNLPSLEGYNSVLTEKNFTQNEGVVVFFKKHLKLFVSEPDLCDANCLMINLEDNITIIAVYRPPGYKDVPRFLVSLDKLLSETSSTHKVLIGDINIDILDNNKDVNSSSYLNMLASHSLLPAHTFPTHGKTCLDHVILKCSYRAFCYVAETSVTDHDTLILKLEFSTMTDKCFSLKKIDYLSLDDAMKNLNLNILYGMTDPNEATAFLLTVLDTVIKANTKTITIPNRKRIKRPWMTPGLLRCVKHRDKLHQKSRKNPSNEILMITYKRYRNFCNSLLKNIKNTYESNRLLKAAKTNTKVLWDTIKQLTYSNNTTSSAHELVSPVDPLLSVNNINKFFVSIGKDIAEKAYSNSSYKKAPINSTLSSFVLLPTDEFEVQSLILQLKKSGAAGRDGISGAFLKRYHEILVPPLTHIFNLIFSTGIFPDLFKLAEVIPVYKGGSRDCVRNYRPISKISTLSKIIEKLINKRLIDYLESNNLLSSSQFGFRPGSSTSDAVHQLTDHIVKKIDKKNKILAVFLDIAKAFDAVAGPILLDKLEALGVRGVQLKLFESYLSDRKQRVKVDNTVSDDLPISYGVPQGSVLGPTLFLIFINDLCDLQLQNGKIITFADDTALVFHGDKWKDTLDIAQKGFDVVNAWLRMNALTINVNKTKCIPFFIKTPAPSISLGLTAHVCSDNESCSCQRISVANSTKYLGVVVDSSLNFNYHLDLLQSRTRKLIFTFKNLRNIAEKSTIKIVYQSLCQSVLSYCITVWGGACKTNLIKLERAQRALLKVSYSKPFFYPTKDIYLLSDVLSVRQLYILNTVLKQHSMTRYDPFLNNNKRCKYKVCTSDTRWSTAFSRRFFGFMGCHLYNKINRLINIYPLTKYECKKAIVKWLKDLDYNETEKLLLVLS